MAQSPCAIVVVTASVDDNSSKVFEAMGAGALDAVNTPVLEHPGESEGAGALLAKIETIRKLLGSPAMPKSPVRDEGAVGVPAAGECLVAIGASAGGPAAVAEVLRHLPASFPVPIVVVQHVDQQFAKGLADWLAGQTSLRVRLAEAGDRPTPGSVLLAGTDNHLVLDESGRLAYTRTPADSSYRPSVDVFFKSVSRYWQGDVVAMLLTGMGRDGAEGLRILHAEGHHTIAQDQASSAVYGMPKAAVELNAATEILPLDKIGPRLTNIVAQKPKLHA